MLKYRMTLVRTMTRTFEYLCEADSLEHAKKCGEWFGAGLHFMDFEEMEDVSDHVVNVKEYRRIGHHDVAINAEI
jgi:hypothetical protein